MPISLSGSLVITGSITTTGVITMSGSIASASYSSTSDLLQGTGSVGFATTASLLAVSSSQQQLSSSYIALSASYNTFSGSASTRITVDSASLQQVSSSQQQISSSYIALSASYNTFSGSASTRVSQIETVYATTGSNSFRANQSITGSLVVSSTITAQTLVVQTVTSSIVYSSGSNIFGSQLTDRQTFTGSVNITGSLALAGNITSNGTAVVLGSGTTNYLPKFTGTTIGNSLVQDNGTDIGINGSPTSIGGFTSLTINNTSNGSFLDLNNSGVNNLRFLCLSSVDQRIQASGNLRFDTSGTPRLTIASTGNVGIGGVSSPGATLTVANATAGTPSIPSLGNINGYTTAFFSNTSTAYGLLMGSLYNGNTWMQVGRIDGTATAYNLLLQPNGGNVGIGTTIPGAKLGIVVPASGTNQLIIDASNLSDASFTLSLRTNITELNAGGTGIMTFSNSSERMRITSGGNVGIGTNSPSFLLDVNGTGRFTGSLSKGSGSFRIEHPLESLSKTHQLVHSFIEGPQADLIYRGKLTLVNGKAQANIDEVSIMTEGTFEALCREVQCFTTNESGWDLVKGKVIGNIIYIESQNKNSTDEISWMVIGERQDKHIKDTDWTDENGKPILEPLKELENN